MPKKTAIATPKPEVITTEAIIVNDGPERVTVSVADIVYDHLVAANLLAYEREAFRAHYRALRNGDRQFVPVLFRRPDGALAVVRWTLLTLCLMQFRRVLLTQTGAPSMRLGAETGITHV